MKKRLFIYFVLLLMVPLTYLGCSKDDDPLQFSLTAVVAPVQGGTVSPSSGIFDEGEQITISATPASGYDFLKWSGGVNGDDNPLQLTITSDIRITAEFALQDADGDGVGDELDQCPNTPEGQVVDGTGCAASELDSDGDGVTNDLDLCANTPANAEVDEDGCADFQKDTDNDGVTDDKDLCPDTPANVEVDEDGCPLPGELTYIPDDVFEQILIDQGYDDVLDDYVLTYSINALTELFLFSFPYSTVNDLTGIEAFAALEQLFITGGDFTGADIDLSHNSNLKELFISCSSVSDLDLSSTNIEILSIGGSGIFMGLCANSMHNLDLSGVTTLKTLNIYNAEFDDLNATLNSATSVEKVTIYSPQTASGPLDYLDLSANSDLISVAIGSMFTTGPNTINLKNGANLQLTELRLEDSNFSLDPNSLNWEPCIEADDPVYIESIITSTNMAPQYSVTTDCGN